MEVQPDTGKVIPDANGMGPTNATNLVTATTAKDLQKKADQTAISENRAATPPSGASNIVQNPITYKGNFKNKSIDAATRMFGNVPNPVPPPTNYSPAKAIPVGAIIQGVQAIGALKSAAKNNGDPKKEDKKLLTTPMTDEQRAKYDQAVKDYKDSTTAWIAGKGPEPKIPDYTSFKKSNSNESNTGVKK